MVLLSLAVFSASILGTMAQSSSSTVVASTTATAVLATPTSFAETDWTYAGCYVDTSAHVLTAHYDTSTAQTQETCVRTCNAGGWGYAGLVYGAQCICGNILPSTSTKLAESECNYACPGDSTATSKCGGIFRMTLFQDTVLIAAAAASGVSSSSATSSSTVARTSSASSFTISRTSTSSAASIASSSMVTRVSSRSSAGSSSVSASASASAIASTVNTAAKSNTGAIAGGVVGGLAALVVAVVGFFLCKRKRSRNENYADRPRSSFVGGSVGGGSGGGGWRRGGSTEDHDGLTGGGGGSLGVGAGLAGVGARSNAARKETPYVQTEKIGLDELSVVPLSSSRHPANAYSYQQESQPPFAVPASPSHQSHPNFGAPSPPVEYLNESTPSSSPPTSFYPVLQNSSSQYPGAPLPRRSSEASSSGSHAPVSSSGAGGVALGRVVSVTRGGRKPVPVMAPEDDAYDGLAYDAPAPPLPSLAPTASSPSSRMSGGEWAGAKEMRVLGVDAPSPMYTP